MNESSFWGSGWSFPPTFESGTNELKLTHKTDNINQSINVILQTCKGERSMQPEFGSGLRQFLFQNPGKVLNSEIAETVRNALLHYEPRITVENVDVSALEESGNTLAINIAYKVKKTNSRHNHVYPFSLQEGTDLRGSSDD